MRAAGKTEVRGQIVDHRFSGDARLGGERTRGALRRNCGREMGDVQAAQPLRCEQAAHRFAGELRIAFLANPAGLPAIAELGRGGAEMIDEIRRHAVADDEVRETLTGADEHSGDSIAIREKSGQALFRESVCKNVQTSVVAVSSKNIHMTITKTNLL